MGQSGRYLVIVYMARLLKSNRIHMKRKGHRFGVEKSHVYHMIILNIH